MLRGIGYKITLETYYYYYGLIKKEAQKKYIYKAALPFDDNPLDGVVLVLLPVNGSETFRVGDEILVRFCFGVCFFFSRPIL